jgi:ABC-2 type transport system permease protein
MKLLSVLRKSLTEQVRDFWALALTLTLAPFFVLFYWLMFGGGSTVYDALVINQDAGVEVEGVHWNAGDLLIDALDDATYSDGQPLLSVRRVTDRAAAEQQLKDRNGDLLITIPADFSQALLEQRVPPPSVELVGDRTNPYYAVSSVIVTAALTNTLRAVRNETSPVIINERALGNSAARTEFETWVPGLFIMAAVLLIYQAAMTVAREIEAGTVRRLQMTPMTALDLLGGIGLSQILIGVLAVIFSFSTAVALGYTSEGPLWIAVLLGAITSVAMVGVGLLVACFSRTVARAFMIANFPLFLMTFFSGMFMPIPRLPLFTLGGHRIGLFDLLPPSHAVTALNKVTALGSGLDDITYELGMLTALSVLYLAGGVALFQRMYLRRV